MFLFLPRIRFTKTKSIHTIIRSRYGDGIIKIMKKLEKLNFKLRNAKLDIEFLCNCDNNDTISKFLRFRTANKNLKDPNAYKKCQKSLFLTEIDIKRSHLRVLQKELSFLRKELQSVLNCIDFAYICSLFLSGNDSSPKIHEDIQENKFNKLLKERQPREDPEKVIFNHSNISLSDAEKSL